MPRTMARRSSGSSAHCGASVRMASSSPAVLCVFMVRTKRVCCRGRRLICSGGECTAESEAAAAAIGVGEREARALGVP